MSFSLAAHRVMTDKVDLAVESTEARVRSLHRATLSLFSDLSLDGVLRRIVQAAKELAGARYAAMGIPDGQGGLETFIAVGLTDEEEQRIPHPPEGRGLLGEMLKQQQTIRIHDISKHPSSLGFPEGHPTMKSFLGVPISAYGRPLGQIYLTDKIDGQEFTESDQRLIEMLAAHAAAAIENARLYRHVLQSEIELTQRNEELELMNSLASAVSSTMELEGMLESMLDQALHLFHAQSGEVFIHEPERNIYSLRVHRGKSPEAFWEVDRFPPGKGIIGKVAKDKRPIWTDNLADNPSFIRKSVVNAGFGTLVAVPLVVKGEVAGVMSLAFHGRRAITERELGLLEAVGAGIGIAIENSRLTLQAQRLAILEERERIGRDLHDGIIQSIYATGLILDFLRPLIEEDPETALDRLDHAIKDLNEIMKDIRAYIMDLQPSRIQSNDLSASLQEIAREFRVNSLVEIDLKIDPDLAQSINKRVADAFFHISREALTNISKHAEASKIWVNLRRLNGEVSLQIIDNGQGFDAENVRRTGHGLRNMEERTRHVNGDLIISSNPGEGTSIMVRVPEDIAFQSLSKG